MPLALELLQWALLLFLAVMVFGLTRQLGFFIVPRDEQLKREGPDLGTVLREPLVTPAEHQAIRDAMVRLDSGGAAVIVVDERCVGCQATIERLELLSDQERMMPLVGVIKQASGDFVERARRVFDVVIEDPAGAKARGARIVGTPYALLVDGDLRVEHAEVGGHVASVANGWFHPVTQATDDELVVVQSPAAQSEEGVR